MWRSSLEAVKKRLSVCSCSRRKRLISGDEMVEPAGKIARCEAPAVEKTKSEPTHCPAQFKDLNDEVQVAICLCLRGYEAAMLASISSLGRRILSDELLWNRILLQEFPKFSAYGNSKEGTSCAHYRVHRARSQCRTMAWRKIPCQHHLGAREGSPGLFHYGGYIFVFGGWGHGPENDLHAGPVAVPLVLRRLEVQGTPIPETYEMKVTLLDDPLADQPTAASVSDEHVQTDSAGKTRVLITGGYLRGGYHSESGAWGIIEIEVGDGDAPRATWIKTGRMTPRSNHSATYVPPRIAGPRFPEGYVLIFGGNYMGRATNSIEILDLQSCRWRQVCALGSDEPTPRNSHSASLLEKTPITGGPGILILGGGNGDGTNGAPPRGGYDFAEAYWLHGLDCVEHLQFTRAHTADESPPFGGRGHVAVVLAGTDTVVSIGGGRPPSSTFTAFVEGSPRYVEQLHAALPAPRAFGGGCPLPDGTLVVYGGWHPRGGTFRDFWAACPGAETNVCGDSLPSSSFFAQLQSADQEAADEEEEEDFDDDMFVAGDARLRFLLSQMRNGGVDDQLMRLLVGGQLVGDQGNDEEDGEEDNDEDDDEQGDEENGERENDEDDDEQGDDEEAEEASNDFEDNLEQDGGDIASSSSPDIGVDELFG